MRTKQEMEREARESDRWRARKRGALYCAPACGGRCTWKAYLAAQRQAGALAKRLGSGWKPRVYENLGWHWNVEKGPLEVRSYREGHRRVYTAGFGLDHPHATPAQVHVGRSFPTPQAAVRAQVEAVREEAERWRGALLVAEGAAAGLL